MKIKCVSEPFKHLAGQPIKTVTANDFKDTKAQSCKVIDLAQRRQQTSNQMPLKQVTR